MTSAALRVFVPLTKIDEEKRLVYGTVAAEEVDFSGEVFDYASSKPFFEKWSGDIAKASGGKSLGNVRVMHTNKAAGKVLDLGFDDAAKKIHTCAKVVDDDEWKKVLEGVYTGFSMGGAYVKRWKGDNGEKRYTGNPVEISLVDSPCIKSATFDVIKSDGAQELRKFNPWQPSNADVAAEATELAKAAGTGVWTDYLEPARESLILQRAGLSKAAEEEADEDADDGDGDDKGKAKKEDKAEGEAKAKSDEKAEGSKVDGLADEDDEPADASKVDAARGLVKQVWTATDGKTFDKKDDCVKYQVSLDKKPEPENPLLKAVGEARAVLTGDKVVDKEPNPIAAELEKHAEGLRDLTVVGRALTKVAEVAGPHVSPLRKSVWDVGSFAQAISTLGGIQSCLASEADYEKDGSPIPKELRAKVAELISIFLRMAAEEMGELLAGLPAGTVAVDATADPEVGVAVAQAAKAATPELLQKRKPSDDHLKAVAGELVKLGIIKDQSTLEEELNKAKAGADKADNLQKMIDAAIPAIEELKKDIATLKAQPMPSAPRLNVMEKAAEATTETPEEQLAKMVAGMSQDQIATLMIKISQGQGQNLMSRGHLPQR